MKWLENIKLILSIFPTLINAIRTIEANIPVEGKGAEKLAMLKGILQASFDHATNSVETFEKIWPMLQQTVVAIVNAFNNTGVFKRP